MNVNTSISTKDADICYYNQNIVTASQPDEKLLRNLADAGFKVVINLGLSDQDYSLENEPDIVQDSGMQYIHIPVEWRAPACGPLHRFYGVMRDQAGKKLFIHCAENKRVAVFMFLYRVVVLGENFAREWKELLQVWEPNETWLDFIKQELQDNDISFEIPTT